MREAVIVGGVRTAAGKAPRGTLRTTRPDDMAAAVIEELLRRVPALPPETVEDVTPGCATPEGESGAKLTVQLLGEMRRRGSRCGLVTMCVGGGQGAATVFENLQT